MRKYLLGLSVILAPIGVFAGDLGINLILSGEIKPGVYGQVEIGSRPPAIVYEQPRIVIVDKRYERLAPVYLHVPPGHAKHWDKHCAEYNACSRRVYFVKSVEYEPANQGGDDGKGNGRVHSHGKHKGKD